MKTGGTMNFLKRAGAILMLVAVFASSCNKYADDFKQINTKLDALAAQVAGVTTLSTDLASLKAQVTALQTAVTGLPTTASIIALQTSLNANALAITAIKTTLDAVALAGTATKTVVDKLTTDLAALATKVAADNAALKLQITALGTTDTAQSAQLTDLVASNATILTSITALQTSLAGLASGSDATALTIQALQAMLDAQKVQLAIILANTSMYNGNVSVTSDAEVTFFFAKIAQLGIVNGSVTIDFAKITAGKLADARKITSQISAVIGTDNGVEVTFIKGDAVDLSALVSVAGNVTLTGSTKGSGADLNISNLSNIGGTATFDYDGAYASPSLTTVDEDLVLVNKGINADETPIGTTSVSFPTVIVGGKVGDVIGVANGMVSFPLATEVVLSGGVSSVTADVATVVKVGTAKYTAGLDVNAPDAAIDLSTATKITGGDVNIIGKSVDLAKLAEISGTLTVSGPSTLTLPLLAAGAVVSDAVTVTMNVHDCAINPVLAKVETLTMGAVVNPLALDYPKLVTADISGKTASTWATLLGEVDATLATKLETITLGGKLVRAKLVGNAELTSVTTSGVINSFTMDNCDAMETLTLGHSHYESTPATTTSAFLFVTGNAELTSLTANSVNKIAAMDISANPKLVTLSLSGLTTKSSANTIGIKITGNALRGTWTPAVLAVVNVSPFAEATITACPALSQLNTFRTALSIGTGSSNLISPGNATINLAFDNSNETDNPAFDLAGAMAAQSAVAGYTTAPNTGKCNAVLAINTIDEWKMVQ